LIDGKSQVTVPLEGIHTEVEVGVEEQIHGSGLVIFKKSGQTPHSIHQIGYEEIRLDWNWGIMFDRGWQCAG
jgi:hypothetical protein